MKKEQEAKLLKKGWTKEEIDQTKEIFLRAQEKKHPSIKKIEKFSYWLFFILVLLGGTISAWLMGPFLLVLNVSGSLIVSGIFGILFGGLISYLVKEIEEIQKHHHLLIALFVVISSSITSILLSHRLQSIVNELPQISQHNPYLIGGIFSICTLSTYGMFILFWWKKHESL